MAVHKLTAALVRNAKEDKLYGDGGGLYLRVAGGGKSWVYRFNLAGKAHSMGLGSYPSVSLSAARDAAGECRKQRGQGINPREYRRAEKLGAAAVETKTFGECAGQYIESHRAGWKSQKHAAQWQSTLETYAEPINALPVGSVDTGLVMSCLEPIWYTKPETATRVRSRIELVLNWAKVRGYRDGQNPAAWRGHMDALLPPREKVQRVKHHAALPFPEMPEFMKKLRTRTSISAAALHFCILTAARSGEVFGAKWDEIDGTTWTIPGERMKAGREHRVPLSDSATAIIKSMSSIRMSDYIFPGARHGRGLSNMAMTLVLRKLGYGHVTTHGFRSSFRDWAAECTNAPNIVCEMALAHSIKDGAEAAYRRGDLLAKRQKLMEAWAQYCDAIPGEVVPINGGSQVRISTT